MDSDLLGFKKASSYEVGCCVSVTKWVNAAILRGTCNTKCCVIARRMLRTCVNNLRYDVMVSVRVFGGGIHVSWTRTFCCFVVGVVLWCNGVARNLLPVHTVFKPRLGNSNLCWWFMFSCLLCSCLASHHFSDNLEFYAQVV